MDGIFRGLYEMAGGEYEMKRKSLAEPAEQRVQNQAKEQREQCQMDLNIAESQWRKTKVK
jgi:hypothetical protein